MKTHSKPERAVATESSGNVFKDLRFTNADELQAKAELTRQIRNILQQRKLSQRAAAELLGLAQPDVAKLVKGRYTGFSLGRLMTLVRRLDRDIEIIIRRKPASAKRASKLNVKAA